MIDLSYLAPELFPRDSRRTVLACERGWWIGHIASETDRVMRVTYCLASGPVVIVDVLYGQWTERNLTDIGGAVYDRWRRQGERPT